MKTLEEHWNDLVEASEGHLTDEPTPMSRLLKATFLAGVSCALKELDDHGLSAIRFEQLKNEMLRKMRGLLK